MSPARTPTEEELALAEAVFGMFSLFKNVAFDAAQVCAVGSPERARLLWSLKAGPVRAGWIAQTSKLSPSAVSELVESLEGERLVRREPDPEDRRAVRVVLTADGRRQLEHFERSCATSLAERLAPLSAAQRQRIRAALFDLRALNLPKPFTAPSRPENRVRSANRLKELTHAK